MNTTKDGLAPGEGTYRVNSEGQAGVEDHNSDIFFAAIQATRMPMTLTDPNQRDNPVVFVNSAFEKMSGYLAAEIIGTNCRFLQGPDTDPNTVAQIRKAIASAEQISVEILNYRKDGASFWNALYVSPVFNRNGKLVYFFSSQLDVSQRRDTEMALRQAQKMEAVGQLTGGIAHDFNNLLQVISGSMEMLKRQPDLHLTPRSERLWSAMEEAATRAKNLTQQLLAFSRKQKLDGRVIDFNDLINSMQELIDRGTEEHVEVQYELLADLWPTRIDPTQAQMAVLNIVINARDAMPNGGMIILKTENITLCEGDELIFEGLRPGNYVRISISDTGTGIPEALIRRVMDPFFTTKEEGKGTGLGLSMVYGFAKQSGGTVHIYSEEGFGTTVRLYFPASDHAEKSESSTQKQVLDQGGSEHILIVDDRTDVADLARAMLEDAGYKVTTAATGRDALSKLVEGHPFKLLFSDLIMPGGTNGISLAREAKQKFPALKVLLTTGYAEASMPRTDLSGREFDVINKPYSRVELIRKIRRILDGPTGIR